MAVLEIQTRDILTPPRGPHYTIVSLHNKTAGEKRMSKECDRAITCVFSHNQHLSLIFSGLLQKDLFKGRWIFFQQIIVMLVTQGLPSSFFSHPVTEIH